MGDTISNSKVRHGVEFPTRVWYETPRGWASRPAKAADHRRRERLAENWPKDPDHGY